jgi:diguanylate cyclase (GGDEF)-like protein
MMILEDAAAAAVPALVVHQDAASATLTAELERLTFEARSDDLTGLLNRRYWSSEAKAVLGRGAATVLLIDVDRFKQVNDRYGHHVGDFVLAEIAAVLRTRGVAGRLGGDEFAVVIEHADPTGAVAGVLIAEIAERFAGHDLAVSVCVGVAATARPGVDLRAALRAADAAAYAAKRSGRATFRVATWEGHQPAEAGAEAGDGARRAAAA